ncbi:MAG: monovalent cation/H+ antiporter complex subunit F [Trueperaceae bacterium]
MVIDIALACIVLAMIFAIFRVLRGPSWGDRIVALDFLGVNTALLIVIVAMRSGYDSFLDAALIVSILGFLTTVALSRYLLVGRVMK